LPRSRFLIEAGACNRLKMAVVTDEQQASRRARPALLLSASTRPKRSSPWPAPRRVLIVRCG